ncbi:extracellular solute-binding protein [Maritalea myrionectae]|uniref:extracellular solute-binding protein n=1 Tax=Maritalea myrionectae TaxID=454601 RepID=UPI00041EBB2D|nr:extracellular solute-binding protein [Maritalea myrionectae]
MKLLGKITTTLMAGATALSMAGGMAHAGEFDGYTLRVKLIGGAQYEPLYTRIPEWEEMTGAKVEILSRKNHFELDREIKQDIASGSINWCVGSNHTSFAPQYGSLYVDLNVIMDDEAINAISENVINASTVDGRLVQLARHSDVSNLYYIKSLYEDEKNKADFKAEYGYDLMPPETWAQVKDQAIFFADPPNFYGTQYVGKDEGISGRFYEMLIAEGGTFFDADGKAAFNSPEGVRALQWFVDLYEAKAVPAGVPNYLWDDTGLGFASGNVALNLDWGGWASYFNSDDSKIQGDVGLIRAPKGSSGKRTGWSGSHSFSITEACDNKQAAASFVSFLTNFDSQMIEARTGLLPTRPDAIEAIIEESKQAGDDWLVHVFETFGASMAEDAFAVPSTHLWIPISNELFPELQAAIVGEKNAQQALDDAAAAANQLIEDEG